MSSKTESEAIAEVQRRLIIRFTAIAPSHIAQVVERTHDRFADSRIRDFVPLLVERRAIAELAAVAADEDTRLAG